MKELINNLLYVRSLLSAMSNLNQEELQVRKQLRQIMVANNVQIKKSQKNGWMVFLAVAFVGLTLLSALASAPGIMQQSEIDYEIELSNDEFNWMMKHYEDGQPYPGYTGSIEEPIGFGTAYVRALPRAGISSLVMVVIGGAIIFSIQRSHNSKVERENKRRSEQYQATIAQNNQIAAHNQRVQAQIAEIHNRKQMISQEYIASVCPWFPKEYCYFEAVDYFIHELEIGTATSLPEAIKNYREFQFRRTVTEKLSEISDKMSVMIDNQKMMIDKQDEMIRQQMIGNFLACATYMETRDIANNVRIANGYRYR